MSNQFFEDEEELARAEAAAQRAPKPKAKPAPKPAQAPAQASGAQPPSFALVGAIAVVALLLGVCIGYFVAMAVVDRSPDDAAPAGTTQQAVVSGADAADASGMPSDHPDISSMINPDGTVNEEALAAYKAQRAAE